MLPQQMGNVTYILGVTNILGYRPNKMCLILIVFYVQPWHIHLFYEGNPLHFDCLKES